MKTLKVSAVIFLLLGLLLSGCETTAGTAKGLAVGIGGTAYGAGSGAVKDSKNTYNFIQGLDAWIKKNLW
jgi:predicted small secreted protein